jgi:hypothetical protein
MPLDDMAGDCMRIRSRMFRLFRASEKHTTYSVLARDYDLLSLSALRLAQSLRTRRLLHDRQLADPNDRVQLDAPKQDGFFHPPSHSLPQVNPIRSSENADGHIFINNPLLLSDLTRRKLKPLLFPEKKPPPGRGRPTIDLFAVLEGILYKFLVNISWSKIPQHYPSPGTCNRYYLAWKRDGTLSSILLSLITLEIDMQYENEKRSEAAMAAFFHHPPVQDSPEQD